MLSCDSKRVLELKEARFEVFLRLKVRWAPRTPYMWICYYMSQGFHFTVYHMSWVEDDVLQSYFNKLELVKFELVRKTS